MDLHLTIFGRWFRFAIIRGSAPGSHMGLWRTNYYGIYGWNFRHGTLAKCTTYILHTKRKSLT